MWIMRRVLLLNASYEALGIISMPRAVRLVWKKSAEIVELDGNAILRSPTFSLPAPSVVRLKEYIDIRARQRRSASKRQAILMRDKFRCQYCGIKGTPFELTLDHITPRSRGGSTEPENLCASCFVCNQRKGDRTPDEARMPLISHPSALYYGLEKAALRGAAETRPEWRKYLFLPELEVSVA